MSTSIVISILGDSRDLIRSVGQSEDRIGKFGKAARVVGGMAVAGAAAVGGAAVAFAAASVKSASDAQQSIGATQTVFGKYADVVTKRSNEAARAIGVSANEYRELSNVSGALLTGAGMPLKKVADLTGDLNTRAADLAATFGGTTRAAVEAISSLMKGEADPIERYGVSIKQSDVNARLAAQGLDKLTGSALKQAEMQARVDLLMSKTTKTAGAFGRESNTLAHQQQVLGAQWENLKSKAGAALLPALTAAAAALNDHLFPALAAMGPPLQALWTTLASRFAPAWDQVSGTLRTFMPLLSTIGTTATGTLLPAVTAVAGFIASRLVPVFTQVAGIIRDHVIPIVIQVATFVHGTLVPAVVGIASTIGTRLAPVFDALVGVMREHVLPAVAKLFGHLKTALPVVFKVVGVVVNLTGKVLGFAAAVLGKVLPPIIRLAGWLIGGLVSAVGSAISIIARIISTAVKFGAAIVAAGRRGAEFVSTVVGAVKTLPGKVLDTLTGLGNDLLNSGKDLMKMLADGISAGIDKAINALKDGANRLKGLLPGSPVKWGPLTSWNNGGAGQRLMTMLADGITPTQPLAALRHVAATLNAEAATLTPANLTGTYQTRTALTAPTTDPRTLTIHLDAEQLHAIETGRRLALKLRPYLASGGTL